MWSKSSLEPDLPPLVLNLTAGSAHAPVIRHAPSSLPPLRPQDIAVLQCNEFKDPFISGQEARPLIDSCMESTGAVLLRGLLPMDGEKANQFIQGLGYSRQSYEPFAGARDKLLDLDVSTTRTKMNKPIPISQMMDVHNEVAYNPHPCLNIGLLCISPASISGGESLLVNAKDLTASIPSRVINSFERNGGVLYQRFYHDGSLPAPAPPFSLQSWQERTGCSNREGATMFWREGMGCHVNWSCDGSMKVWNVQPAMAIHPKRPTEPRLWFNLAHIPSDSRYGNGRTVEPEVIEDIVKARWRHMQYLSLRAGEMLLLDNYLWLHGRMPFQGNRTLATILTSD